MSVAAREALLRQFEEYPEKATLEELQAAQKMEKAALRTVGLNSGPLVNILLDMIFGGAAIWALGPNVETKQTCSVGDSGIVYARNPRFQLSLDPGSMEVVDIHEALHPFYQHLNHIALEAVGIDPHDPVATLAFEAFLNFEATLIAGGGTVHKPMPTIAGKVTGVDYAQVHKEYKKDLTDQGLEPMKIEAFYKSDVVTYLELKRMTSVKARKPQDNFCKHDSTPPEPETELRKQIKKLGAKLAQIGKQLADAAAASAAAGKAGPAGKAKADKPGLAKQVSDLQALGQLMSQLADKAKAEIGEGHTSKAGSPGSASTASTAASPAPSAPASPATDAGALQLIEDALPKFAALLDTLEGVLGARETEAAAATKETNHG
jgi:hypothetical protein